MKITSTFKNILLVSVVFSRGFLFGMEGSDPGSVHKERFYKAGEEEQEVILAKIAKRLNTDQWKIGPEIEKEINKSMVSMLTNYGIEEIIFIKKQKYELEPRRKGFELLQLLKCLGEEANSISVEMYKRKIIDLVRNGADLTVELDLAVDKQDGGKQPLLLALNMAVELALAHSEETCLNALSEIAAEIIEMGKVDLEAVDNEGYAALNLACLASHIPTVKLILGCNVNVNTQAKNGKTALYTAAEWSEVEVAKLLVEKGVDPTLKDNSGKTALDVAKEKESDFRKKVEGFNDEDLEEEIEDYEKMVMLLAEYEKRWAKEQAEEPAKKKQRLSKEEE